MSHKQQVQSQFGTQVAVDGYATSDIHAKGESLTILNRLITPQPEWRMLDVATGAGHTAHRFAPRVKQVIATDLTDGMVQKAADLAATLNLNNVETRRADAEALPFDAETFDLVTCRLAFHHFPHPEQALSEMARVLKPGGYFGLTDNITVEDTAAAAYYNAYEKLRDPSHHEVLSLTKLQAMLATAGLTVAHVEQLSKEFEFHKWADRQSVSPADKQTLLAMMAKIPAPLTPLFQPRWANETMYFSLWEVVLVAQKKAA